MSTRMIVGGVVGGTLVTAAALFGLFLVWQLWWTNIPAREQAQAAVTNFHAPLTPAPRVAGDLQIDRPPVPEAVAVGETFGVLIVPQWDDKTDNQVPIVEGTSPSILDAASAGHYTHTQQVGEVGNFALGGHRRTHGNPFLHLPELAQGDQVIVETAETWYVYEVTGDELVLPSQVNVIAPVPHDPAATPHSRLLTLTTCHSPVLGSYGTTHRWITYARFVGWMDRDEGMPEQVLANPEVL